MFLRLREAQLRLGLVDLGLIVARVDPHQYVALVNVDVVVDIQRDHIAGYLRRDRDRIAVGVRVVRGYLVAGCEPPDERDYRDQQDDAAEDEQGFLARLLAVAGIVLVVLVVLGVSIVAPITALPVA